MTPFDVVHEFGTWSLRRAHYAERAVAFFPTRRKLLEACETFLEGRENGLPEVKDALTACMEGGAPAACVYRLDGSDPRDIHDVMRAAKRGAK